MILNVKTVILLILTTMFFSCKINHSDIKAEKFFWYYKTRKINRVLIDTRTVTEYQQAHIPEAYNVPINSSDFKAKINQELLNAGDVWIIFAYAQNKKSTQEMKAKLSKLYKRHFPLKGPTAIYYLEGGYEKWIELPENK